MSEPQDERPWSEAEWEAFLDRADFCSARYQELFETLADDPQRDQIIGHEMGWDEPAQSSGTSPWLRELEEQAPASAPTPADLPLECWPHGGDAESDASARLHAQLDAEEAALNAIPAYRSALSFSDAVRLAIMAIPQDPEAEPDDDLVQMLSQTMAISAKVAAGHGMGYRDQVLGGNIVQCRRALAAADSCMTSLQCLAQKRLFSPDTAHRLEKQLRDVQVALEARVGELRARVWW